MLCFACAPLSLADNNGYRITQPRANRKLGFGSYDANRRDEFTLDIRASQYRELLEKERFFEGVYLDQNASRAPGALAEAASSRAAAASAAAAAAPADPRMFQTQVPTMLYDIGKASNGTTPICNKCSRETFYCKHRVGAGADTLRRLGPHKTMSAVVGSEVEGAEKPHHGRKSAIKDFYDQNHLSVISH